MSYLGTSNSLIPATYTPVPPTPTKFVQYCYRQTANTATTSSGGFLTIQQQMFQFNQASINVTDNLFVGAPTSPPTFRIPKTGLWSLSWTVHFNNPTTENIIWFNFVSSQFYGDLSSTRRLAITSTPSTYLHTSFTGYFVGGDTLLLNAFTAAGNGLVNTYPEDYFTVTLIA